MLGFVTTTLRSLINPEPEALSLTVNPNFYINCCGGSSGTVVATSASNHQSLLNKPASPDTPHESMQSPITTTPAPTQLLVLPDHPLRTHAHTHTQSNREVKQRQKNKATCMYIYIYTYNYIYIYIYILYVRAPQGVQGLELSFRARATNPHLGASAAGSPTDCSRSSWLSRSLDLGRPALGQTLYPTQIPKPQPLYTPKPPKP